MEEPRKTGEVVAAAGGVIETVINYGIVVVQLSEAASRLRGLAEQVRGTYRYVEHCSDAVDRLAGQMAGLHVDRDTVGEHHQAAAVMRAVLETAEAMAAATEDLASRFAAAAAAHQTDYGTVAQAAAAMPVPMAEAGFYSNR